LRPRNASREEPLSPASCPVSFSFCCCFFISMNKVFCRSIGHRFLLFIKTVISIATYASHLWFWTHMFGLFNFNEMPDEATSIYIWCSDCHWLLMSYEWIISNFVIVISLYLYCCYMYIWALTAASLQLHFGFDSSPLFHQIPSCLGCSAAACIRIILFWL
jgi:hypothetical protein